ncbi:hypothetical protein [Armatimonas sp.]|uniref:hypothetical protein n=1 Tax=Armatimonas sp. TaxID=1872638 RepID=UPI00286BA612|nr:hypothetical protein [Armatimonas sp.]
MPTIHTRPVCRLFVLLARDAPLGVILRSGPKRLTQLILWHTDTDMFEPGDRHVGHFYPERGDLSPDGKLLIYVAANYTMGHHNKGLPSFWTALSKPPSLTPLGIWPNNEPYYLGGLFASSARIEINLAPYAYEDWTLHKPSFPAGVSPEGHEFEYENLSWNPNNQFFTRLMRNGWTHVPPTQPSETVGIEFEKGHPLQPFILRQMIYRHAATFEVQYKQRKISTPLPGAVWADWDQRERLVYSQEGKLFTADINVPGKLAPQEIDDFTPNNRKRLPTPNSAGK